MTLVRDRNSVYLKIEKIKNNQRITEIKYLWINKDFTDFGERVYKAIKELIDKTPEEKREYADKKMIETFSNITF